MSLSKEERSQIIEDILLHTANSAGNNLTKYIVNQYGITAQTVNRYYKQLVNDGKIEEVGNTRNKKYKPLRIEHTYNYSDINNLEEDIIWSQLRHHFEFLISNSKKNVYDILHHGVTEMINNVIDHSNALTLLVRVTLYATHSEVTIVDDGIGIFKKIKNDFNLSDISHAPLELSKGKLTSDSKRHSGEGIFFTSKMFDFFCIFSDKLIYAHDISKSEDYVHSTNSNQNRNITDKGTVVLMKVSNNTNLTTKQVFDEFTSGDNYSFSKTIVPVELLQNNSDQLVSRSQAKRLISRFDKFEEVILDFSNVESIGQAFADEIFRVFKNENPHINIKTTNVNNDVLNMINRVSNSQ